MFLFLSLAPSLSQGKGLWDWCRPQFPSISLTFTCTHLHSWHCRWAPRPRESLSPALHVHRPACVALLPMVRTWGLLQRAALRLLELFTPDAWEFISPWGGPQPKSDQGRRMKAQFLTFKQNELCRDIYAPELPVGWGWGWGLPWKLTLACVFTFPVLLPSPPHWFLLRATPW